MKRILSLCMVAAALFATTSCAQKASSLEVSFNYEHQDGPGSNQYAVWVENAQGKVVRTFFVTSFTTKGRARGDEELVRGYIKRPACVPDWVKAVNANELSDEELDVFTGATPQSNGVQTFTWDFKDQRGVIVPKGEYKIIVEATLIFDSDVKYVATISTDDEINKTLEFTETITKENDTHRGMIKNVTGITK